MSHFGKISSPHFGEKFEKSKFDKEIQYQVDLENPYEYSDYDYDINEYIYDEDIKINIEYDIHPDYECILIDSTNNPCLSKNQSTHQTTLKHGFRRIYFQRNFPNQEEVDKWKNKRITGFNVSWHCSNCSGELSNRHTYENYKDNRLFIKIANLIHKGTKITQIWKIIKSKIEECKQLNKKGLITYDKLFNVILNKLNDTSVPVYVNEFKQSITEDTLAAAAKIYFYLKAPYQEYWDILLYAYTDWLESLTLSRFLGIKFKC